MTRQLAELLFRLAIRAFPAGLRRDYGAEMLETFQEAQRHQPGPSFVLRAISDALKAGWTERWRAQQAHITSETRRPKVGTFWQDVRYGARSLFKHKGFTTVAVLTIGLGIGANAAIFSVVHGVLLSPLPFQEPERLVGIWESRVERGWTQASFTRANFWDVQAQNRTFSGIAAMEFSSINLTGIGYPERLRLGRISAEFFQVLGVTPYKGRLFTRGEDAAGAPRNGVLLAYGAWQTRFGGEPGIVGRQVTLDGQGYTVVGVLPRGEPWLDAVEVFVPMEHRADADRGSFELSVIGRLKPGVTTEAARADLQSIAQRLAVLYPVDDKGMGMTLEPSSQWVAGDTTRRALWILMGSVAFLLLIACVNLANLFLARATGKAREQALRSALGASRGRLVRQVLTESRVVRSAGAVLGLAMAFGIVQVLKVWNPAGVPRISEVAIDGWVLGFTAIATVVTALLAGMVPALHAGDHDLAGSLKVGDRNVGGGRSMGRLRAVLVATEVAASLALLIGAGLLLRSFQRVMTQERGFVSDQRVLAEVALPATYDNAKSDQFLASLRQRLEASPEVTSMAVVSRRLLTGVGTGMGFGAADKPDPDAKEVPWAAWRAITRGYFKALGVPLIAGRDFAESDIIAKPWRVIVSKSLADRLWPGEAAVGRQLIMWKGQSNNPAEVIGVAGDMRDWSLQDGPSLGVYFPYYGAGAGTIQVVLHTRSDVTATQQLLRGVLAELDPGLPLSRVESLDDLVGSSVASRRFVMMLLAAFASVALILALAGIYGVLSYAVSRRTSEIGVRLALGASPGGVLRLIVAQGMLPVAIGVVAGVAAAVGLTRLMASLLFGVSATDVATYAAVAALLGVAGLLSCYLPARQALKVDVVAALRKE